MAAPERFAEKSDLLLQRGHRPYMALFDVRRGAAIRLQLGVNWTRQNDLSGGN